MRLSRLFLAASVLALVLLPLARWSEPAAAQAADFEIPNGHFYTQTNGGAAAGTGYGVIDDGSAQFWSEFQRLGGVDGVGYPVSHRFVWDGFVSQAFQKGVFQWRPEVGQAFFVNVFDQMSKAGQDGFLLSVRQVPGIADWSSDTGKPFDAVVTAHQGLLEANAAIKAAYFAVPDPMNLYGLPMAPVTDLGNVLVLRAQRVVIQQWKVAVPWAAAGQVTVANGGDVAKEAGLLPKEAIVPGVYNPAGGAQPLPAASASPAPALPTATSVASGPRPALNPRELRLSASVDNNNPPAGGRFTLNATITDEAGQPIPGAALAVIVEFGGGTDFADFAPNTNDQGKTSVVIDVPSQAAGKPATIRLTAVFSTLSQNQELSINVR